MKAKKQARPVGVGEVLAILDERGIGVRVDDGAIPRLIGNTYAVTPRLVAVLKMVRRKLVQRLRPSVAYLLNKREAGLTYHRVLIDGRVVYTGDGLPVAEDRIYRLWAWYSARTRVGTPITLQTHCQQAGWVTHATVPATHDHAELAFDDPSYEPYDGPDIYPE